MRLRFGSWFERGGGRSARPHDAAHPARRLSRRAGGRRRRRAPPGREGHGPSGRRGRRGSGRRGPAFPRRDARRRRRRQRDLRPRRSASAATRPSAWRSRGTSRTAARRRLSRPRGARARHRPRRLRLGLPKGDHANIGLGGWEREAPRPARAARARSARRTGSPSDDLKDVRGYRLPLRSTALEARTRPAAVIGDAAGLVDPVSGDGMFEAFLSGRLAAEAVLDVLAGRAEGWSRTATQLTGGSGTTSGPPGASRPRSTVIRARPSGSRALASSGGGRASSSAAKSRTSAGRTGSPAPAQGTRGARAGGRGPRRGVQAGLTPYDASVQNYLLTTLDSGTRVVTEPLPASARSAIGLWIGTGLARRGRRARRRQPFPRASALQGHRRLLGPRDRGDLRHVRRRAERRDRPRLHGRLRARSRRAPRDGARRHDGHGLRAQPRRPRRGAARSCSRRSRWSRTRRRS